MFVSFIAQSQVEGRPLPSPPSLEEAFILLDYSNPNFFSKPKEEKAPETVEYIQEKKELFFYSFKTIYLFVFYRKHKKNYMKEIKSFMEETYEKTAHETKQVKN